MPLTRIFRCPKSLMQQAFPGFWRDAEKPWKISKKSRLACANATKNTLKTYRFKRVFFVEIGGEEGIRTLVRFNPQTDFESESPFRL